MSQARSSSSGQTFALFRAVKNTLAAKVGQSRGHLIASGTLAFGYCAQLAFQMVYFLILTRMLGPELFGRFAAALAAINLVAPIAGIGFAEVALVRVSQDREKTGLWAANALATTAVLGAVLALCLALVSGILASDQWLIWQLMLGLAFSELVLVRCCIVIARVHQARREIVRTAVINVAVAAMKAMIALGLLLSGQRSLVMLIILLDICFTPLLFILFMSLTRHAPTIFSISWRHLRDNIRLALSFATAVICKAVYTDLDKLFLARWSTSYVVGTYAAGYKMLSLSFMPMRAVLEATLPRQIQLADYNRPGCSRFTVNLLLLNVALAGCIAGSIYLLAPWATLLLGEEFEDSIGVLRIGFLLPVLQAVHYTLGNYLTATGHQSTRAFLQLVVLVVYVVAGLIVIPLYSWQGAIWTSLGCESLLALLFGLVCIVSLVGDRHESVAEDSGASVE